MDGKEFSDRMKSISKIKVEIGRSEDPELARRQEKQIMELPAFKEAFADYEIVGIEQWLKDNRLSHEIQSETNKEESKYGDIVLLDGSGKTAAFVELKVGTKPPAGKGPYYGACSIMSLCNKLKAMQSDRIPRILLAIDSDGNYRVCDPLRMFSWLCRDPNAFLMPTSSKSKANWSTPYTRKLSGTIRVGHTNATATKDRDVHGADYFPSFPFARNLFHF